MLSVAKNHDDEILTSDKPVHPGISSVEWPPFSNVRDYFTNRNKSV